jgi:hypothetical protein
VVVCPQTDLRRRHSSRKRTPVQGGHWSPACIMLVLPSTSDCVCGHAPQKARTAVVQSLRPPAQYVGMQTSGKFPKGFFSALLCNDMQSCDALSHDPAYSTSSTVWLLMYCCFPDRLARASSASADRNLFLSKTRDVVAQHRYDQHSPVTGTDIV